MVTRVYLAWLGVAFLSTACAGKSPSSPSPLTDASYAVVYTAMGASDVTGVGASSPCLILFGDCPDSTGYVFVAAKQLRAKGFSVTVNNLGIPTGVIGRDFQDLGTQYGHFVAGNLVENEAPVVSSKSTLITIFIGGNDVNVVTGALGGGAGASDQTGYINAQIKAFGADFTTLVNALRARAPSARIVVLNLPNMSAMPFLSGASAAQRQAAQLLSVGMTTTVIDPLTAQNVLVVDMMCDARSYQASTYSSDGFHPSDAGYAWIAGEVVAAATTSYKPPQASCAQMALTL
jgi:lysophospholipase L1-like esterase